MDGNILVIDDDEHICDLVRISLEAEGFTVSLAMDGDAGLNMLAEESFSVVILDIMLPGIDGLEICRQIRNSPMKGLPVIMLTARGEEVDRVLGLELGADDYVTKPFSPRELSARVKALIRRSDEYNSYHDILEHANLVIDLRSNIVRVGESVLKLTPKELALLVLLAKETGKPFTREELLRAIWGFEVAAWNTRTVDEHIKRLRKKIALHDSRHTYLQTVWGEGYRFEVKCND